MYRYSNLLVAHNLTDMDKPVMQYAGMISHMAKTECIYNLHLTRNLNIPREVLEAYSHLMHPLDEFVLKKMRETVKAYFEDLSDTKMVYSAKEGVPLEEILQQITARDIDMFILGRKTDTRETRRLLVKLVRKAPCSVFIVPERTKPLISRLLVPVDFSKHSEDAMDVAVAFAASKGIPHIQCLNVYQLPTGYYKTGKTEEEFSEIMKKHAREKYKEFIQRIDLKGVSVTPEFVLDKEIAKSIHRIIRKEDIDLMVIGARGRSTGAGVLLGSVTEDLIRSTDVPLIAVKKKGAGITFTEALFKYD
ncbi:MAG: universal stress protein [Cytophagales bacterium]|nr:universal stress protein [Cytophagales bacterium]